MSGFPYETTRDSKILSLVFPEIKKGADLMSLDLVLRHIIITIAIHLAVAWLQAFQSPWPLVDAFELADCAEDQLFKSLGFSLKSMQASIAPMCEIALISHYRFNARLMGCAQIAATMTFAMSGIMNGAQGTRKACSIPIPATSEY